MFIQQWINALQLWFGAWVLFNNPTKYVFNDFLVSNFALLFSLFGLGSAFQDIADRKETEKSASRIFFLLDRESKIDPLGEDGKVLDINVDQPILQKKKSIKKKKSSKAFHPDVSESEDVTDTEDKPRSAKKSKEHHFADVDGGEGTESEVTDSESKPKSPKKKKKKKKDKSNDDADALGSDSNHDKPKSSKKKKTHKKKKTVESDEVDHSDAS